MPKVSVIVPVYGVEEYIERCAVSLFSQKFDDIEYIFIDDASPDNSIEILKKILKRFEGIEKKIKIISHDRNRGLAAARNTGVSNAAGDYIMHVDSDDFLDEDTIDKLYNKATEENAQIVCCDFMLEWKNTRKISRQSIGKNKVDFINLMLAAETQVGLVNKLIKRSLYSDNNIQSYEGVNLGEDFVTTPRLAYYADKISKVNQPLYHYVKSNENSYTKNLDSKKIENLIFVLNTLTDFFKKTNDFHLYEHSILKGKLRKKIEILSQCSASDVKKYVNIFPETDSLEANEILNWNEKNIYKLVKNRKYIALNTYKKLYGVFFHSVQLVKRR